MLTSYTLVKHFKLRLFYIFISVLVIKCDGINSFWTFKEEDYCPFIETLSFGSDIDIKCNDSYLIFNEINDEKLDWKFLNQSFLCEQQGKQQAFVNQCNITRIESKYLKVPLESISRKERACVYCPINYEPIAPIITVTQSSYGEYTFNLTATGLNENESFEILWARRTVGHVKDSILFWFLQTCIHEVIDIRGINNNSIIFMADDADTNRVEFIIRRCIGTCRTYKECSDEAFAEMSSNDFQIPDSIEKVSCDSDCLNGIVKIPSTTTTTTTTTIENIIKENVSFPSIGLSNEKSTMKFLIIFLLLGVVIVILFILFVYFIICKLKGSRTDNIYRKTSNINLDETKHNVA